MNSGGNDYAAGGMQGTGGGQPSWQQGQRGAGSFRGGHGGGSGGGGGAGAGRKKLDLSEVLCFKCGEYGHFANHCPNPNKPGQRGQGVERKRGGFNRDGQGGGGDSGYGGAMGGGQQY